MIRSKDVLSAAHIFAICIILVLSLSIITYPIGFLARADIATSSTGTATTNTTLLNTGVDDSTNIADATGSGQPVIDSPPNAVPSSDYSSPPDSSTDSSSITSTSDSSLLPILQVKALLQLPTPLAVVQLGLLGQEEMTLVQPPI